MFFSQIPSERFLALIARLAMQYRPSFTTPFVYHHTGKYTTSRSTSIRMYFVAAQATLFDILFIFITLILAFLGQKVKICHNSHSRGTPGNTKCKKTVPNVRDSTLLWMR